MDFLPTPGRVTWYHEPSGPGVRVDSALSGPGVVSPFYDPMVAKMVVHGETREQAAARARRALHEYWIGGITTNIPYHAVLLGDPDFLAGRLTTEFIPTHPELLDRARDWRAAQEEAMRGFATDRRRVAAMAAAVAAAGGA